MDVLVRILYMYPKAGALGQGKIIQYFCISLFFVPEIHMFTIIKIYIYSTKFLYSLKKFFYKIVCI